MKNLEGEIHECSDQGEPYIYLHGVQPIVKGLQTALEGKVAGDKLDVIVSPIDGYGEYDEQLKQVVPKSMFSNPDKLKLGMELHTQTPDGHQQVVTVCHIEGEKITVDANHQLAGKELHFDVEVLETRQATVEELKHGHAHTKRSGCSQ